MFKKYYLPVGLILAVAFSLLLPSPGIYLKNIDAIQWFIITIFLINGFQFKNSELNLKKSSMMLILVFGIVNSLIFAPLLGVLFSKLFSLNSESTLGLIVTASVPPTLSSGIVITQQSNGNVSLAILLTLFLNLLGILILPLTLNTAFNLSVELDLDTMRLFLNLIKIVLAPFLIGFLLRKLIKVKSIPTIVNYIPSTCVILTVLASTSYSRAVLLETPLVSLPMIVLAVSVLHLILFFSAFFGSKILNLAPSERNALVFVSSQKTLPLAISVLTVLKTDIALALIICLFFHFIQLLLDAFLAEKIKVTSAV